MINIIAAFDNNKLMGVDGMLPWKCPEELHHFRKLTTGHIVIMGRKTWEAFEGVALKNRVNVVVTNKAVDIMVSEFVFRRTLPQALLYAEEFYPEKKIFIIGGADLIKSTIPLAGTMYLSHIKGWFEPTPTKHDLVYFPKYDESKWLEDEIIDHKKFTVTVLKRCQLD